MRLQLRDTPSPDRVRPSVLASSLALGAGAATQSLSTPPVPARRRPCPPCSSQLSVISKRHASRHAEPKKRHSS